MVLLHCHIAAEEHKIVIGKQGKLPIHHSQRHVHHPTLGESSTQISYSRMKVFYMRIARALCIRRTSTSNAGFNRVHFLHRLPLRQFLVPPVSSSVPIHIPPKICHSPRKSREVALNVDVRNQPVHNCRVPRDERQICDRHLVPDQILLLREHPIQHPKHTLDLIVVPLDRTRQLLSVEFLEPRSLAEVRTASPPQ